MQSYLINFLKANCTNGVLNHDASANAATIFECNESIVYEVWHKYKEMEQETMLGQSYTENEDNELVDVHRSTKVARTCMENASVVENLAVMNRKRENYQEKQQQKKEAELEVVLIEPYYGGSHKQLIDLIVEKMLMPSNRKYELFKLPDRKWHWRIMASSVYFAEVIPQVTCSCRFLFCSSMLNLTELLGLRPDLCLPTICKIYYFHENQLSYPVRKNIEKSSAAFDFQIGWAQILSCISADIVLFNSKYNRDTFFGKINSHINQIPEKLQRVGGLVEKLKQKSRILYFPLTIRDNICLSKRDVNCTSNFVRNDNLTVVWNHRWEYDKNPECFFKTLFELEKDFNFNLVVMGENFSNSPDIFEIARKKFDASKNVTIIHWGFTDTRQEYVDHLLACDVVVSTSDHEFFGVAVLEAVLCGCLPICPKQVVYPEFFPSEYLFNTQRQLYKRLKYFCEKPSVARKFRLGKKYEESQFQKFTWQALKCDYGSLFATPIPF